MVLLTSPRLEGRFKYADTSRRPTSELFVKAKTNGLSGGGRQSGFNLHLKLVYHWVCMMIQIALRILSLFSYVLDRSVNIMSRFASRWFPKPIVAIFPPAF
jgi:hypothetical protein